MKRSDRSLDAIVALKRQGAEQRVAVLTQQLDRLDRDIASRFATLAGLDSAGVSFDARQFAEEHGFVQQTMFQAQEGMAGRAAVLAELDVARQALREAIYSESQIGGTRANS